MKVEEMKLEEVRSLADKITDYFNSIDETFSISHIYDVRFTIYVHCDHYSSIGFIVTAMDYDDIIIKTYARGSEDYNCVIEINISDYIDIGKKLNIISDISDEDRADIIALNIHDYINNVETDTFISKDGSRCHSLEFENVDIEQIGIIFQTLLNHVADFKTVNISSTETDVIIVFKKNNEFIEFCMDYFKGFKFRGYGF